MDKVKLNLQKLTLVEKIELARQIVTAMTGNANFTTPSPALVDVTGAADGSEAAYNNALAARNNALQKTVVQEAQELALDEKLTLLASYVDNASGGSKQKILSSGMAVRGERTPSAVPGQPQALTATSGDDDGQLDLQWDSVTGAKSYTIDQSTGGGTGSWQNAKSVTKSQATIGGLISGQRYWFRVAAIGAAGQGAWSDPATKVAG